MIVVDWGTTNLRVFACEEDGTILKSVQSAQGIKVVPQGGFATALTQMIDELGEADDLPIFVCGMAGARSGWHEAPYCETPISLANIAANLTSLPDGFDGYLLPGARTLSPDGTSDVMRGEEIQIFGAMARFGVRDAVLCLPGTHSKWVRIRDGQIVEFATFMTGDIYQALAHTILGDTAETAQNPEAFLIGLEASVSGDCGLLHRLFTARTRVLDGELTADQVPSYVSGLLIGHELAEAVSFRVPGESVLLIGAEVLNRHYLDAFNYFNVDCMTLESSEASCAGVAALLTLLQEGC